MTKLPVCSGEDAIRVFNKAGWIQDRRRGSHVTLIKGGMAVVLTVPLHRELGPGLLRSLIRKAGLTVEEFQKLLD
ncbi:MAG: type II toxin-antitoxin system HicA family toxin [Nitrospira sp. SB0672_bin_25]|nr:type II toxin-antitoxin system HicA family toxin [Nitrospira sp. SB0666_bin_27]MYF25131.1 type II toxin-antitoxin system HicA family toxin [Nitrospira sp. SB0678_bin_10]MYJ54051.1 type II toxin-antitoxin system HicA family toxin [Nitrospira sp. SB0672_bin_25]